MTNRIDLNPKIWGPNAWFFIESSIMSYPTNPNEQDKLNFKNFLINLSNILPCSKCRLNYKTHLEKYPLDENILQNKDNLFNWILNIHNLSSSNNYNFNSTLKFYNDKYTNFNSNQNYYICIILIFLLLIILYYIKL